MYVKRQWNELSSNLSAQLQLVSVTAIVKLSSIADFDSAAHMQARCKSALAAWMMAGSSARAGPGHWQLPISVCLDQRLNLLLSQAKACRKQLTSYLGAGLCSGPTKVGDHGQRHDSLIMVLALIALHGMVLHNIH